MTNGAEPMPRLCHVGGEDVYARIPMLERLADKFEPHAAGSGGGAQFLGTGIAFHHYHLNRSISPFDDRRSVRELRGLFEETRPEIVHAFDTKPAIYAMDAAAQAQVLVRLRTITGMGYLFSEESLKARILRRVWTRMQRRIAPHIHWTVFQNSTDRDYFHDQKLVVPERSSIIAGSGIDEPLLRSNMIDDLGIAALRKSLGLGDGPVVMMAARLVIQKGVREFIAAARLLQDSYPGARFLLVGPAEGEGREAIPAQELKHVPNNLVVTGRRPDIVPLLQMADICVLPSYYREGVPRVLLEAALMKTAIVTTDMPGCRDVVDNGRLGQLVNPRDPVALAEGIGAMLKLTPTERSAIAQQASAFVGDRFSLDRVTTAYRNLYLNLLEQRRSARET
jgi:glycosyltransferase involved in cell wall biosynthesis